MAEKQFALSGSTNEEFFADDDPLAELARIVGFETRPAAPVAPLPVTRHEPVLEPQPAVAQPAAATQPADFGLEDELEREFALYDSPRLDPVDEIPLHEPRAAPVQEEFAAYAPAEVEQPQEHVSFVPAAEPSPEPVTPVAAAPSYEETFPIEELLEAELAADVPASEYQEMLPEGDHFASSEPENPSYPTDDGYAAAPDASGYAHQSLVAPVEPAAYEPHFALEDLADELEQSIAEVEPVAPAASVVPLLPASEPARFRMPLANFNVASHQPAGEPVEPEPAPVVPANLDVAPEVSGARGPSVDYTPELPELDFAIDADQLAAQYMEGVSPSPAPVAPKIAVDASQPAVTRHGDFDDLLADVERYAIPAQGAVKPRYEPAVDLFPAPAAPVTIPPAFTPAPENPRTVAADADFAEFELDLDGIELELSDMNFDGAVAPPEPAPVPAPAMPVALAPIVAAAPPAHSIWDAPFAAAASAAAQIPAQPAYGGHDDVFANAAPAPRAPAESVALPFDPALIAEPEERPEAIAELDVPALPVIEKEEPVALPPEYDIDIDAEMANLFDAPNHDDLAEPAGAAAVAAGAVATGATAWAAANSKPQQSAPDDFDVFEKALEEDFRQTMNEPQDDDLHVTKMTLDPGLPGARKGRTRSLKGMLLASSLLVVGGGAAYGAYSWFFGDAAGTSSNGPIVIAADKDPVKIVPENPGGKTVPNQDKAVYDRVAGASVGDPKQEKLVSSTEEPIDVVQRTLIPESLPLEGAEDDLGVVPTPAGETVDERLLPSANGADAVPEDNTPAGVAARKVRSMIVKPDGTIVARETLSEPEPEVALAPAAEMPKPGAAEAELVERNRPALAESNVEPAQPVVNTAPAADLRASAPAEEPSASDQVLSEVANSNVGEPAPVRTVTTSPVGGNAPTPAARPAEQPVNVVGTVTDQGNVQSAPAAAEPAQQVASVAPGTYYVQVASLPSEAEARKSYDSLSRKFPSIIAGRGVDIKQADIPGRGTFYRVRIPGGTKDEAAALCERYRAAGGSCLIAK